MEERILAGARRQHFAAITERGIEAAVWVIPGQGKLAGNHCGEATHHDFAVSLNGDRLRLVALALKEGGDLAARAKGAIWRAIDVVAGDSEVPSRYAALGTG